MAVTQSGITVADGGRPARNVSGFRGIRRWVTVAACSVAAAAIASWAAASAYQPLAPWGFSIGGFPGVRQAANVRIVNDFGGQIGEDYIPHQRWTFGVPVDVENNGPLAVTIEAVSMRPPHPGILWALSPAGPALYKTIWMTTGDRGGHPGRPIAGLVLKPGHGVYVVVPVRTPRCYIPRAFAILSDFYVKERFGPFTKWARVPLMQPLMLNAPESPAELPDPNTVCTSH